MPRFMAKTETGPKILKQALTEEIGKLVAVYLGSLTSLVSIGVECLTLSLQSPQTYVCRSEGYALAIEAQVLGRDLQLHSQNVLECRARKFSDRLKDLTQQSIDKYRLCEQAQKMTPELAFNY